MMHFLAYLILVSPIEPHVLVLDLSGVYAAVQALAGEEELVEVYDGKSWSYNEQTGQFDERFSRADAVRSWRERWHAWAEWPRLRDARDVFGLTEPAFADEAAAFGRRWLAQRQKAIELAPDLAPEWRKQCRVVAANVRAWELLSRAVDSRCSLTSRREALYDLRELIGAEAFYRGAMPAVVPAEYLGRID